MLVIVGGFHVRPGLVLPPSSLLSLRLLQVLGCLLRGALSWLSILQSDPLGLGLRQGTVLMVSSCGFLAGLLPPSSFQEFMELLLGGEVSATGGGGKGGLVEGAPHPPEFHSMKTGERAEDIRLCFHALLTGTHYLKLDICQPGGTSRLQERPILSLRPPSPEC